MPAACLTPHDRLDAGERARLEKCTLIVQKGAQTFLTVGESLLAVASDPITGKPLYRETHPNLQAWLEATVPAGLSRRMAYYLIEAARTEAARRDFAPDLPVPANERSIRPLEGLDPEVRAAILTDAHQAAQANGQAAPTYKEVEAARDRHLRAQDPARRQHDDVTLAKAGQKPARSFHYIEPTALRLDHPRQHLFLTVIRPANAALGQTRPQKIKDIPLLLDHIIRLLEANDFRVVDCREQAADPDASPAPAGSLDFDFD